MNFKVRQKTITSYSCFGSHCRSLMLAKYILSYLFSLLLISWGKYKGPSHTAELGPLGQKSVPWSGGGRRVPMNIQLEIPTECNELRYTRRLRSNN
jgi:hypothetical protein